MNGLFDIFTAKYGRISTQFVRGLEQDRPPYRD